MVSTNACCVRGRAKQFHKTHFPDAPFLPFLSFPFHSFHFPFPLSFHSIPSYPSIPFHSHSISLFLPFLFHFLHLAIYSFCVIVLSASRCISIRTPFTVIDEVRYRKQIVQAFQDIFYHLRSWIRLSLSPLYLHGFKIERWKICECCRLFRCAFPLEVLSDKCWLLIPCSGGYRFINFSVVNPFLKSSNRYTCCVPNTYRPHAVIFHGVRIPCHSSPNKPFPQNWRHIYAFRKRGFVYGWKSLKSRLSIR